MSCNCTGGDCLACGLNDQRALAKCGAMSGGRFCVREWMHPGEHRLPAPETPSQRMLQAIALVNKAMAATEVQQLACTEPRQDPSVEAIEHAAAMLPHGIELVFERDICRDLFIVDGQCPHCGKRKQVSQFTEGAIESVLPDSLAALLCARVRTFLPQCISAECCDPLDRFVDGLTVRECLERYQMRQRQSDNKAARRRSEFRLTPPQLEAARLAWSAELKRKAAEARERGRNEITVDDDRWEP